MAGPATPTREPPNLSVPPAAIALASAANPDPALTADVRTVLREQAELLRLQKEQLREETRLRRWMLRFEHASAGMKVAFEIAAAFIVVVVAVFIGGAVWSAVNDNGLVVEAFSVPSDYASRGLTGQVLASHLLDRLSEMQVQTKSLRRAATYTNNWGNDIKVEIPTTGISLNELQRLLNARLGHETRISGEVFRTGKGVAVAVRVGVAPATTFEAAEADIDALMSRAAEEVYKQTQPFRYAYYLMRQNREDEAQPIFERLTKIGSPLDRAWAYSGWATQRWIGRHWDIPGAIDKENLAIATDPELPAPYSQRAGSEAVLGHLETALADTRLSNQMDVKHGAQYFEPESLSWLLPYDRENIEELLGDFRDAAEDGAAVVQARGATLDKFGEANDLVNDHDVSGALRILQGIDDPSPLTRVRKDSVRASAMIQTENWPGLATVFRSADPVLRSRQRVVAFASNFHPGLAYGLARAGDVGDAEALISPTPLDCYGCVQERGDVAAVKGDRQVAERWYAEAIRQAPSIPFAYSGWGAMLLHRGDYDGAIAKFAQARQKGSHYADPLEMWGEALMLKDRSDLALEKFEEANKYAPRWGRLHLKWGEALVYLGREDQAQVQFRSASGMDLSSADQAHLASDIARSRR